MAERTELHFDAELKPDAPPLVIQTLAFMTDGRHKKPFELPKHRLFEKSGWDCVLAGNTYRYEPENRSRLHFDEDLQRFVLRVRNSLVNYDGEIFDFIEWITPYLDEKRAAFLGFHHLELFEQPTLISYYDD